MIPSVLARQLQQGYRDYLATTFPAANEPFRSSFQKIADTGEGLYLEPYTALRLPYRTASTSRPLPFAAVEPAFTPWVHQRRAWDRLSGEDGRSTIVATGTGSGKTECFLYPVLDYCWRHRGEPGIKALIIYPMNALATDQAARIARLVDGSEKLRGNVTAGLFVGGFPEGGGSTTMGPENVITNRETMIEHPPSILLTNYKMLDLMLMRPHDAPIWSANGPETLKYVVVDELHTFDGAQGTDLACLLRRLKSRLYVQPGYLCCVGTSATLGGNESAEGILKFASDVFGQRFDEDALISEERLSADDFLSGVEPDVFAMPSGEEMEALARAARENDAGAYLSRAMAAFMPTLAGADADDMGTRLELGRLLPRSAFFQSLLRQTEGGYFRASEAVAALATRHPELAEYAHPADAVDAMVALVSHARTGSAERPRPLLDVQTQLWARELARVTADVAPREVGLELDVNLNAVQRKRRLPLLNCRDCGQTAWVGIATQDQHVRADPLGDFYRDFFGGTGEVVAVWPREPGEAAASEDALACWLCPECRTFEICAAGEEDATTRACPDCDAAAMPVWMATLHASSRRGGSTQYVCPHCGSTHGLSLVGLRSTVEAEVALTELFSSDFDDDAKVLVFSDNVQDASYRASFFNGRTWKFGLRSAIAEYLRDGGEGGAIGTFGADLAAYWRDRLGSEDFVARFMPPNDTWMREYEYLIDKGSFASSKAEDDLVRLISKRMSYEVLLEFGMRSQTGRTLEKSAVATVAYEPGRVDAAARDAVEILANELGIKDVDAAEARSLVLMFLDTLRLRGAFADERFFGAYVAKGAQSFLLSHKYDKALPGSHASGMPSFLLVGGVPRDGFDTAASAPYRGLAERFVDAHGGLVAGNPQDVVDALRRACERAGLLGRLGVDTNYECVGLAEDALQVTGETVRFTCGSCGGHAVHAAANAEGWEGAACARTACAGVLSRDPDQSPDYYGALFGHGLSPRVEAREHTGLLERDEREELEDRFKAQGEERRSWYPNVLSCTPTLEMGIDVGDLSTLVLCGVPPTQAQFVQRVGRAGRRDGNALTVVLADATAHGSYFYSEPESMFAGNVEPPHVFLQAGAVLERQFSAFCLDSWVRTSLRRAGAGGAGGELVPKTMFRCLQNMAEGERASDLFPFNFLEYVKLNMGHLVDSFLSMFADDFAKDSDVAHEIEGFAKGSGAASSYGGPKDASPMYVRFYDAFAARRHLRDFYQGEKKDVEQIIRDLEAKPKDSSFDKKIKEAKDEERVLQEVIKDINHEDVFGFLTRESLLPNYAFPEEGAHLRTVLRRPADESDAAEPPTGGTTGATGPGRRRWVRTTKEYARGAGAALTDFAPGNTFYASGHHFKVDQVDLSSAQPETWRLCPECSHAEHVTPSTPAAACPRCGSTAWADADQKRTMLRLSTVISNGDYEGTLTTDASEQREHSYFANELRVEVDPDQIASATQVTGSGVDFGFEYVRRATLREINFGPSVDAVGTPSRFGGVERVRSGFQVCRHCGAVVLPRGKEGPKADHAYTCPVKRGEEREEDALIECLFLYREFQTEAVRILIPQTTFVGEDESIVETFEAAVMLGLREKFGNVDHLSCVVSEEPLPGSSFRKRYLVVYDTVPGGTGYLKQFSKDGKAFLDVLARAYEAMDTCSCKDDPNKDGCYRCVFSYRQSRDIGRISRRRAMEIIERLLSSENKVTTVRSIEDIQVNELLESELEAKFVAALAAAKAPDGSRCSCSKDTVHDKPGKPGYLFRAGGRSWEVEPQVTLGPEQGVAVMCRPDFVFWPMDAGALPVAVFTDGFEFHKEIVADDTLKREAVRRSGRFRVWSLSYQDVEAALDKGAGGHWKDLLATAELPWPDGYHAALQTLGSAGGLKPQGMSSFDTLVWYLSHGDAEQAFGVQAQAYSLGMTAAMDGSLPDAQEHLEAAEGLFDEDAVGACAYGGVWEPDGTELVRVSAGVSTEDVAACRSTVVLAEFDDSDSSRKGYQREWNGFWALWNVMQFFSGFAACSATGLADGIYDVLPAPQPVVVEAVEETVAADASVWDEVLKYAVDDAGDFVERLRALGMPAPDPETGVGYELDGGEQAELAWPDRMCCYLTSDQRADAGAFTSLGWRILIDDSTDAEISALLKG